MIADSRTQYIPLEMHVNSPIVAPAASFPNLSTRASALVFRALRAAMWSTRSVYAKRETEREGQCGRGAAYSAATPGRCAKNQRVIFASECNADVNVRAGDVGAYPHETEVEEDGQVVHPASKRRAGTATAQCVCTHRPGYLRKGVYFAENEERR